MLLHLRYSKKLHPHNVLLRRFPAAAKGVSLTNVTLSSFFIEMNMANISKYSWTAKLIVNTRF